MVNDAPSGTVTVEPYATVSDPEELVRLVTEAGPKTSAAGRPAVVPTCTAEVLSGRLLVPVNESVPALMSVAPV